MIPPASRSEIKAFGQIEIDQTGEADYRQAADDHPGHGGARPSGRRGPSS